jgi:broad specificity phosphatase PhoE
MPVLLMRHGEPDWPLVNDRGWVGLANDFTPLTRRGIRQAETTADALEAERVSLVLSSPMTRALQTAAIVAFRLAVPLQVELDLREWLPDETYSWSTPQEVFAAYDDMLAHRGVRPEGHPLRWEPLAQVRDRATHVLEPYADAGETVVAVCHEVLIQSVTGEQHTGFAQTRPLR